MFMPSQTTSERARSVTRLVSGVPATDGAGVRLNRVIGTDSLPQIDPFLMLDEIRSDDPKAYIAGFPAHPHRGFETISYMLAGKLRHSDNAGNEGSIGPGGIQWMTAARGIIHTEIPEQSDGLLQGFQIWLNLPASEKMLDPKYRNIEACDIPSVIFKTAEIKVLAGQYHGLKGPITSPTTQPFIADVALRGDGEVVLPIPETHQGFVYAYEGGIAVEAALINRGQAGLLGEGNCVRLTAGQDGARALIVAGRPLGEPIARHGPFVMNTQDEIKQAFTDYQNGLF